MVPRLRLICLAFFVCGNGFVAQAQKDVCHVYIIDQAKAERFAKAQTSEEEERLAAAAITLFPEFYPTVGEEELTTKTYRFPRSKLIITASVFYTDESMGTSAGADSIIIGIVVSRRRLRDALSAMNNVESETSYNRKPYALRAKKWLWVNRRLYRIGIECRTEEKADAP